MRFKIIALAIAGLALAACETPSGGGATTTSGTGGTGAERSLSNATPGTAEARVRDRVLPTGVKRGSNEDFINLGDRVFFATDQYNLDSKARETLELQAVWLKQYPNVHIVVQGHTDERGTREYNLALAERRAISVKNYLVALGIEPNRVKTISYGKEVPFDPRSNEEAWALNRRGVTVSDAPKSVSSATN
jgi:peptidoglycan-associated lipoprotein